MSSPAEQRRATLPPLRGGGAPSARRSPLRAALACAVAAYAFVAAAPIPPSGPTTGLDGSWLYEVNRLAASPGAFGGDVAFTFGPLAFLALPIDVGHNLALGLAFRWLVLAGTALLLFVAADRARHPALAVLPALALAVAIASGLSFEYQVLVATLLLAWLAVERGARWLLVATAALASPLLLAKTSLGMGAASIAGTATLLWVIRRRPAPLATAALAALAYAAPLALAAFTAFDGPGDLLAWLRLSVELAGEYSVAMSLVGPWHEVGAAVAVLAVLGVALVAGLRAGRGTALLLAAGPAFLAFKHGFVRHDHWHVLAFFPFLLVLAAVALLDETARARATLAFAAAAAAALALVVPAQEGGRGAATLARAALGAPGLERLPGMFLPSARRLARPGWDDLAKDHVPGLSEHVAGRTVGVVPWELTHCPANGLRCVPNPLLQLYATLTAAHDERTARHFAGAGAPEVLLARLEAIDDRNLLLDTPATWRSIFASYRPSSWQPAEGPLVLERRTQSASAVAEPRVLGRETLLPGRWADVPPAAGAVSASVELSPNLAGRLAKLFFRVPPVYLDVLHCDGHVVSTHRLVAATARNGLPLAAVPLAPQDLARLAAGAPSRAALRVRLHGEGLAYYRTPAPLTWLEGSAPSEGATCSLPGRPDTGLGTVAVPEGAPLLWVDVANGVPGPVGRTDAVRVGRGERWLQFRGWAVDPVARRPALGLLVTSGERSVWVPVGFPRPDVANHFGNPAYERSGFLAAIPADAFGAGRRELRLHVVRADGSATFEPQILEVQFEEAPRR